MSMDWMLKDSKELKKEMWANDAEEMNKRFYENGLRDIQISKKYKRMH